MFGHFGPNYSCSEAVTFRGACVRKRVDPHLAAPEAEITQAAHDLGRCSGQFEAPRVLGCNPTTGVIEFDRVHGLLTVGQVLRERPGDVGILHRIGHILAHIHTNLKIHPRLRHTAPLLWPASQRDTVTVHGDFNTINVACRAGGESIVLLDWASARALGPRITVGPRYVDLAQFLRSLVVHQANPLRAVRLFRRRAKAFLDGYEQTLGRRLDGRVVRDTLLRISTTHLRESLRGQRCCRRLSRAAVGLLGHAVLCSASKAWIYGRQTSDSTLRTEETGRRPRQCA